jgi:hypothetical protein
MGVPQTHAATPETAPLAQALTARAEATIAAVRAAGLEVIAWTPAPVVTDPAERAALQAGEERFYDALLDIWTDIIAREMATQDATQHSTPDQVRAEGAGAGAHRLR